MDTDVAYADCALDAWASWVRGGSHAWPTATLLDRIIQQGISGAAQHSRDLENMPEEVLTTDRAVAHLHPFEKRVVFVYYLTYADSEVKAKECGCSRRTFFRRIIRAQKSVYRLLCDGTPEAYSQAS